MICKLSTPILLGLLIGPFFFSPYLKSLYEEGLVFALLPWVVLSSDRLRQSRKVLGFTVSSALLILAKTQLILFLPAMLWAIFFYSQRLKLSSLKIICVGGILILAVSGSLYQKLKQEDSLVNAYNRLFNGIGWSMQSVHTWPANHFIARLKYFSSHQNELQELTKSAELIPNQNLWGTSFWPKGVELLTSGNDPLWEQIEQHLDPKSFLEFFYSRPGVLAQYVQNGVMIFITSNYSFSALREIGPSTFSARLEIINYYCLQAVIWVYSLLFLHFWVSRKGFSLILGMLIIIGAPFAVLVGDGFFEFEKHLTSFWITLPLLVLWIPLPSSESKKVFMSSSEPHLTTKY